MSADPYRFDHLTKPGDLSRAIEAESKRGTLDTGTCRHCGQPIYFAPYFLDGKLPNPPVWQHSDSPGSTCARMPKGWRKQSWPCAEPVEKAAQQRPVAESG